MVQGVSSPGLSRRRWQMSRSLFSAAWPFWVRDGVETAECLATVSGNGHGGQLLGFGLGWVSFMPEQWPRFLCCVSRRSS